MPQLNPASSSGQTSLVRLSLVDLQSQEYGTKYWTAVCALGTVMELFANYLWYAQEHWTESSDH